MRQNCADSVARAVSSIQARHDPNRQLPSIIAGRFGPFSRFSLMVAAAVIGTAGLPEASFATPYSRIHAPHSESAAVAAKPAHNPRHARVSLARVSRARLGAQAGVAASRSGSASHASLSHGARSGSARSAGIVHHDAVPLANTTWDNPQVPLAVRDAIQSAARESGVDPKLLTAIAWRESRFDPNARNQQSSAKGLLQFTSGTWLQVVRDYGSQHDVADYAAAIRTSRSGDFIVPEQMRSAILDLRDNPILSAKLAAQDMLRHRTAMEAELGRSVTSTDLYLLHVLGPTGAMRFLKAVAKHPSESSLQVASLRVMRNAGLLARDGRPLTVAKAYASTTNMLNSQDARSAPFLASPKPGGSAAPAAPIQVSVSP